MEKFLKFRRIIFAFFLIIFVIGAVFIFFYSRGLNFDLKTFRFQKTGAIFIETTPKNVNIKIDGKNFKDLSGPLSSGTLISNLSPKTYKLKITKNGFLDWEKNVLVKPAIVSEAINIILMPQDIKKELIFDFKKISDFLISPKEKIIFKTNDKLYFYISSANLIKLKGDTPIEISSDGTKAIIKDSSSHIFYFYSLKSPFFATNINLLVSKIDSKAKIKSLTFHPFDSNRIIVDIGSRLLILDTDSLKTETIFESLKKPFIWELVGSKVYFFSDEEAGFFNLVFKTRSNLPSSLFNILNASKVFKISPDGKKIAFVDQDNQIKIYFLEDQIKVFPQKAGDIISLNLKNQKEIKNIYWYPDNFHLFIELPNEVYFTEVDSRQPINNYLIDSGFSKFYYDDSNNTVFLLENGSLYKWQMKY